MRIIADLMRAGFAAALLAATLSPPAIATPADELVGTLWTGRYDDTVLRAFEFRRDGMFAAYLQARPDGVDRPELGEWRRSGDSIVMTIGAKGWEYARSFEARIADGKLVGVGRLGRYDGDRTVQFAFDRAPACSGEWQLCRDRAFCVDPELNRSLFPIPGLTAPPREGADDFDEFHSTFLCAAEMGLADDYINRVRFPLTVTAIGALVKDPSGKVEVRSSTRSVGQDEFAKEHIYDTTTSLGRLTVPFGPAFAGSGDAATYLNGTLLRFKRIDGVWTVVETGTCHFGRCPATLLCGRPARKRSFPGRGPDGNEGFHKFYEAFYCYTEDATGERDDALVLSRVRFPVRATLYGGYEAGEPEIRMQEAGTYFPGLGGFDGGVSPPRIKLDGDKATVSAHSMGSEGYAMLTFQRINGLWYLTEYASGD